MQYNVVCILTVKVIRYAYTYRPSYYYDLKDADDMDDVCAAIESKEKYGRGFSTLNTQPRSSNLYSYRSFWAKQKISEGAQTFNHQVHDGAIAFREASATGKTYIVLISLFTVGTFIALVNAINNFTRTKRRNKSETLLEKDQAAAATTKSTSDPPSDIEQYDFS